jgi:hypothetical protein
MRRCPSSPLPPSPTVSGDALGARASGAQAGETLAPRPPAAPGGAAAHAGETLALPGSDRGDRHSFRSPAIAVAPR